MTDSRIEGATPPPEDEDIFDMARNCRIMRDVGYKGQRYEVRAWQPKGDVPRIGSDTEWEEFIVGYTDQADGGGLVRMVSKHPTWQRARVIDLGEDEWKRDYGRAK